MSLINKLKRAPLTLEMLTKVELGQLYSRGLKRYLRLRCKTLRTYLNDTYPKALQIEPYGGCNIRCVMCFQGRMKLPADKRHIDLNEYKRIIDEVSPFTSRLYLYWRGEPMLHPNLAAMIAYARQSDMYVFVSTNAVLLTKERAQELIDVGLDFLLVGFDGATKGSYEGMRRGANFEEVLSNLRYLVELKRKQKVYLPHICLQFIVSSINQGEMNLFRHLSNQIGADSYIEKILDLYANFENPKIDEALRPLFVEGNWSKYTRAEDDLLISSNIVECEMAKRMVIRADGEMNLCCYDMQGKYRVGSTNEANLMKQWYNPQYITLRMQGQKRELPLCKNCGIGLQR